MPRFIYVGDPRDNGRGPSPITLDGQTFELRGKPVEVNGPQAVKLAGHDHFRQVADKAPKPDPAQG